MHSLISFLILVFLMVNTAAAESIKVAVASNFINPIKELTKSFEQQTGVTVKVISGSTGKHFAQIQNGAPFDLFLAADTKTPLKLIELGLAEADSAFTYAIGKLVLWSRDRQLSEVLFDGTRLSPSGFRFLAVANPKVAPYGKAAKQVLEAMNQWSEFKSQLVRGENINQTYRFVASGNAELGFVAFSQVYAGSGSILWKPPQSLYDPIRQDGVIIRSSEATKKFAAFMQSEESKNIIRSYGYEIH